MSPPPRDMVLVLKEPAGIRHGWEKHVLNRFASSVVDARDIRADPAGHILCLSFFDISNLIDLEPEGGTYVYSSSEAYNEEQLFDQVRLGNWLSHFGMTSVGGLPGAEEGPFHASGHIDGPGMEWLIETINPDKIVPVHTQQLVWFEARWPDQVVQAEYGKPLVFD
jgi:ribonuclease J